jgi:hypothetical protein
MPIWVVLLGSGARRHHMPVWVDWISVAWPGSMGLR